MSIVNLKISCMGVCLPVSVFPLFDFTLFCLTICFHALIHYFHFTPFFFSLSLFTFLILPSPVEELSKDGEYADNDSIVAFARMHNVTIIIHNFNQPRFVVKGDGACDKELHVAYLNGEHCKLFV